ncbi:MAG: hypothetical protein Q9196_005585, partial [Gyalolechia fulgens]
MAMAHIQTEEKVQATVTTSTTNRTTILTPRAPLKGPGSLYGNEKCGKETTLGKNNKNTRSLGGSSDFAQTKGPAPKESNHASRTTSGRQKEQS